MMAARGSFSDLAVRATTGIVMAVLGLSAVLYGGWPFKLLAAAAAGIMAWELARMLRGTQGYSLSLVIAAMAALAVLAARGFSVPWNLAGAVVVAGFALAMPAAQRPVYLCGVLAIIGSAVGLIVLREDHGPVWILWLVLVVIASDVAGYFAGRLIGGPKFWPRISPKKTWSGTAAGWLCAGLVGITFAGQLEGVVAPTMGVLSVLTCLSAQFGDIAESWIKRRMGIKDASQILPGHGGVMDRFDGLVGAALFVLLYQLVMPFPPMVGG